MINPTEMQEISEWMVCQEQANLEFTIMINNLAAVGKQQQGVIDRQAEQIADLYVSIERFKDRMDEDYDYFHTYIAR